MIEISKSVPCPMISGKSGEDAEHFMPEGVEPRSTGGRPPKYPFYLMEDGDSVLLPIFSEKKRRSAISSSQQFGVRHGCRFVYKDEEGGIRFWRIDK